MQKGVVAHLFCEGKIFLIKRGASAHVDPHKWDSVSGAVDGNESYIAAMGRELKEEIGVIPRNMYFLGTTRMKHGFFVGSMSQAELSEIRPCDIEVQGFGIYDLADLGKLDLGGALKHHYATYPESFERAARGFGVSYFDFRLTPVRRPVVVC